MQERLAKLGMQGAEMTTGPDRRIPEGRGREVGGGIKSANIKLE